MSDDRQLRANQKTTSCKRHLARRANGIWPTPPLGSRQKCVRKQRRTNERISRAANAMTGVRIWFKYLFYFIYAYITMRWTKFKSLHFHSAETNSSEEAPIQSHMGIFLSTSIILYITHTSTRSNIALVCNPLTLVQKYWGYNPRTRNTSFDVKQHNYMSLGGYLCYTRYRGHLGRSSDRSFGTSANTFLRTWYTIKESLIKHRRQSKIAFEETSRVALVSVPNLRTNVMEQSCYAHALTPTVHERTYICYIPSKATLNASLFW